MEGRGIIRAAWAGDVIFALTAVPAALRLDGAGPVAAVTALVLFSVSLGVWVWAFGIAVRRSADGDDIVVANLFFLQGSAPRPVRTQLFAALGVCLVITVLTAARAPFGVLVPMLPLGLMGLWGARHGVFHRRADVPRQEPARRVRPVRERRHQGGRAGE